MTLKHLELRQWELDSLLIIVSKEHVKIRVKINQKWTWQCWTENYINIKKSQQKRWRGFLKDKYLALDIFSRILSHITFSLPCLALFFLPLFMHSLCSLLISLHHLYCGLQTVKPKISPHVSPCVIFGKTPIFGVPRQTDSRILKSDTHRNPWQF